MTNLKFHDYLNEQLKDPAFRAEFEDERAKLEKAIALSRARKQSAPQSTITRIGRGNNTND